MKLAPLLAAAVSLFLAIGVAQADPAYPTRVITVVVPYPPGSSGDLVARIIGERLKDTLGQAVIVDNKTGASGSIGTSFVARAPADGYTLLTAVQAHTTNGLLYSNIPWDPVKSFAPIILVGTIPNVIVVSKNSPIKTLKDFVDLAKSKPGQITFASSGVGTSIHLTTEMLKASTGISLVHVPYKSDSDSYIALRSGDVIMSPLGLAFAKPLIDSGELRALAVTTPQRSRLLPDVPTCGEAGYPGVVVRPWYAFLAPAGTPDAIVKKLNAAINEAVKRPEIQSKLQALGLELDPGTPDDLTKFLRADVVRWDKVIKQAGIHLD